MKVRPLADRLLVKREVEEDKTESGIIIPDNAKEKPQRGKVIAVGNGKILEDGRRIKMDLKRGDRILFGKYAGSEIKVGKDDHLILKEDDVLAILDR